MIIGIGCDVVEHEVAIKLGGLSNDTTRHKIFSQSELDIYFSKQDEKFLMGRFAAKEAIVKCLGTGMQDGISLTDIQILNSEIGKPKIILLGKAKSISDELKIDFWHISITHSEKFTFAFVVAESLS